MSHQKEEYDRITTKGASITMTPERAPEVKADSKFKVETEPEKFDHLHPYPDIYYEDDEDVIDEDEDDFDDLEDEEFCPHGNPYDVDCDSCKDEIKEAMEAAIDEPKPT